MEKSTEKNAVDLEKEEINLTNRILKILMESQGVQDAVDNVKAMVDTKEQLHIDLNTYKKERQFLELSIENIESNPALISSAEDLEKYERYTTRLPVVNKSIKLLARRIDETNAASIERDISDLVSDLKSAMVTALRPMENELQKRVNKLSEDFLAEVSSISSAFTRANIKQKLISHSLFPSSAIQQARPKIENIDELALYADTFGGFTSAVIGGLKKDLAAANSALNTMATRSTPGGTPWQVAESAPSQEVVRPGGGNFGNPHVPTI